MFKQTIMLLGFILSGSLISYSQTSGSQKGSQAQQPTQSEVKKMDAKTRYAVYKETASKISSSDNKMANGLVMGAKPYSFPHYPILTANEIENNLALQNWVEKYPEELQAYLNTARSVTEKYK